MGNCSSCEQTCQHRNNIVALNVTPRELPAIRDAAVADDKPFIAANGNGAFEKPAHNQQEGAKQIDFGRLQVQGSQPQTEDTEQEPDEKNDKQKQIWQPIGRGRSQLEEELEEYTTTTIGHVHVGFHDHAVDPGLGSLQTQAGGVVMKASVKPLLWERFIGGDLPSRAPFCGCLCTVFMVLLCVVAAIGGRMFKMSDAFGFFVLGDTTTQAFFAHHKLVKDMNTDAFAAKDAVSNPLVSKRTQYLALATVFLEVKGTKCPGDECDLKSKNLITSKYLTYMKRVEEEIWNDEVFQKKYCALLSSADTKCRPPKSPLSLMFWGDGISPTEASKALAHEGYSTYPGNDPAGCNTWQSPWDQGGCSSPAWSHVNASSGAALPADLQSYSNVIDKICTRADNYWASLQEAWLPNFACTENHMKNHGVPFLRSQILFGLPYNRDQWMSDIDYEEEIENLIDDYGQDFFKLYDGIIKDVLGGDDDVNIIVDSPLSSTAERRAMQLRTLSMTLASFLFVFLYMWFNIESCFLALFGMLQVLFSIFPTVIVWYMINQQGVQFMQFLAVFMILGIGADDTFVLNDAWKQVKFELKDASHLSQLHIFTIAYRRSFFAMLATTMTTAWCFLFGALNPIPAIANFCIFACLIVIFDFLFCISMFAACVAFQNRFMVGRCCCCCGGRPAAGTCCAPGCCWGFTRMVWRKCRSIPAEETTDQRSLELFFSGPLLRFLQRFKYPLLIFWLLLLAAAITSAAVCIRIAEKNPEGLPADHPLQRYRTITNDYFTRPDPEKVIVMWGLSDEGPVSKWSATKGEEPANIVMGDISAAVSKNGQQQIFNLCSAPTEQAGSLRCFEKACLVKGSSARCQTYYNESNGISYNTDPLCQSGRYCIMEQVKEYADKKWQDTGDQKYKFPLEDFHAVVSSIGFQQYMRERSKLLWTSKQHWHALNSNDDTGILLEGSEVKYMWITFNATFEGRFLPPKVGTEIYDDWEAFLKSHVDGTKFYQVHLMYLFKVLQDILLREAIKSIVVSLLVAFVTLALVTWNWVVASLGLFSLCTIIIYFLGLWPVLGWELDIYNVIFCIMAVGLSVDYTVHLLHAYNTSEEESRELRVEASLSSMGITVLSGAITTLLAAAPLLFTVPTFFNRFGTFVFITIFFSIVTALFLLVPLLLVLGPEGKFGDIQPMYSLSAKIKGLACSRWLCQR